MTLEEKVGQLMLWDARSEDLSFTNTRQPGSILHILGAKISHAIELAAAQSADVVVAVVGDHLNFIGETHNTATLELQGGQVALLDALAQTGKPLIVALVNNKPLVLPPSARHAAAILEGFNPGM